MLFYFARHGQTEANSQGLLAGSGLNHALNPIGHKQAAALAEKSREILKGRIHRIIASDMTRARETAEYLARGLSLPLEIHSDLREWHLGEWEGKTFQEFGHEILGMGEPKQGESRKTFYDRIFKVWQSLHSDLKPYVLVSHGAVWLAFQDLLNIPRFKVENCDLVKVEKKNGVWRAEIL